MMELDWHMICVSFFAQLAYSHIELPVIGKGWLLWEL